MSDAAEEVRGAVRAVRREALKAAIVTATVEAVLAGLLVNAAVTVLAVPVLATPLAGPATAGDALAAAAAVGVAVAEVVHQSRRPAVERFEAVNPAVEEALRTARDTVERDRRSEAMGDGQPPGGEDGPVVRALHGEVLDRLRETSSRDLLPWRRLAASVLLVAAVSVGTVAVAQRGVAVGAVDGGTAPTSPGTTEPADVGTPSAELQSGEAVLGEETNVSAGDDDVAAEVGAGPGQQGDRQADYDRGGLSGDGGGVDARRAGYSRPEPVEEADLIREYTLALGADDGE